MLLICLGVPHIISLMGFLELFILLITYSQHQGGSGVLFLLWIQTQSDSWRGCLEVFILVGITIYIQLQGGFWSSFFLLGIQIQSDSGRYCLELFILLGISTLSVSRRCLEVSNLLRILKGFPLNHIHYR